MGQRPGWCSSLRSSAALKEANRPHLAEKLRRDGPESRLASPDLKAKSSVQAHLSRAESVSAKRIRLRADLRGRAYPAAKGRAGGKLPSGNVTVRSPPRSFSAASR